MKIIIEILQNYKIRDDYDYIRGDTSSKVFRVYDTRDKTYWLVNINRQYEVNKPHGIQIDNFDLIHLHENDLISANFVKLFFTEFKEPLLAGDDQSTNAP